MEILNNINEQLDAFKAKREELVKQLRTEFPALILPIFAESKRIESIGWNQYTPYFNDGDECVFGVHNDDLAVNGIEEYDDNEVDISFIKERVWIGNNWVDNPDLDTHEFKVLKQIEEVLRKVPDDFYKDLFGDHVTVTIYKDGRIETEEYEHD